MTTTNHAEFSIILDTLTDIYGGGAKGSMTYALAECIWENMPLYRLRAENERDEKSVHYQLHMQIWNWFAGGTTAEAAATRILAALDAAS